MESDKNGLLRLTVRDVDEGDVGKYTCRVYNSHGEDNCSAELLFECKCVSKDNLNFFNKKKKTNLFQPLMKLMLRNLWVSNTKISINIKILELHLHFWRNLIYLA